MRTTQERGWTHREAGKTQTVARKRALQEVVTGASFPEEATCGSSAGPVQSTAGQHGLDQGVGGETANSAAGRAGLQAWGGRACLEVRQE